MQIFAQIILGKKLTLEVEPSDQIAKVRSKLEDMQGFPPDIMRLEVKGRVLGYDRYLEGYTADTSARYLWGPSIFEDEEITPELAELITRSNLDPPVEAIDDTKTLSDYKITEGSTIFICI